MNNHKTANNVIEIDGSAPGCTASDIIKTFKTKGAALFKWNNQDLIYSETKKSNGVIIIQLESLTDNYFTDPVTNTREPLTEPCLELQYRPHKNPILVIHAPLTKNDGIALLKHFNITIWPVAVMQVGLTQNALHETLYGTKNAKQKQDHDYTYDKHVMAELRDFLGDKPIAPSTLQNTQPQRSPTSVIRSLPPESNEIGSPLSSLHQGGSQSRSSSNSSTGNNIKGRRSPDLGGYNPRLNTIPRHIIMDDDDLTETKSPRKY